MFIQTDILDNIDDDTLYDKTVDDDTLDGETVKVGQTEHIRNDGDNRSMENVSITLPKKTACKYM